MRDRKHYELQFSSYPDVVTTNDLRVMLGGICEKTAYGLLRNNKIQHFCIRGAYRIPKVSIIDFMMSDEYIIFRRKIEQAHYNLCQDKVEKIQRKILMLCEQPQTRKDLMFIVDVSSKKTFFRLYLKPLLESGKLEMTIPNQRSISTQRYVRVKE